jgi:2-dehydro-3-deoxyphosphogluconate aldolase/(4S)-4-hydroxy-2-oxoglutarate aldolase
VNLREVLRQHRLMAVVRADDPQAALDSILVLADAGITLVEVSLTSKDAVGVLVRARAELGPEAVLGAGTVLTEADVVQAEQADASFIVMPGLAPALAESLRLGLPALVGALTPTEVVAASLAGAAAVKLFPASLGGPAYLRALREPFPDCPFVPFGGVDTDSVPEYFAAGALAVGVGAPLLGDAPRGGDLDGLRERAQVFLAAAGA